MSTTMIQIRNVPVEVHRRLKARAATEGVSMSDFVLREVRKALERPTRAEVLERLKARPRRPLRRSPTELLREERDAR
jgi:plasmid stability protein